VNVWEYDIQIANHFGLHGGVVVSTVASQQKGSRLDSRLRPFCVEFVCSPRVCMGFLRVLQLPYTPKNMHVRLIGDWSSSVKRAKSIMPDQLAVATPIKGDAKKRRNG